MSRDIHAKFSRRERQIMDAVFALGEAGAAEVVEYLRDADAHDSVRVTLANLEKKGFLRHYQDGQRHIYHPKVSPDEARRSAMRHVVRTFFGGDASRAILALLDDSRLSREELQEIARLIDQAGEES
jgi:predicted transcriptional regulator